MVPPARDKKHGVSETVDTTNRIHKPASNSGRGQSQVAMPQADSSSESSDNNMDVEKNSVNDCDTLCEAMEEKKVPKKRGLELDTDRVPEEPTRCQKHNLMSKARGLLNLVGPYLEEMEKEFSGSGADILALISEGVSRAMQGKEIYMKNPATSANISLTR
ncbi:hypothetical protein EPUL_006326, partial [Erysiphe pulchra]